MKKNYFFVLLLFLATNICMAQTEEAKKIDESKVASSYDRSGFTYLLLNFENDTYARYIKNATDNLTIPDKFDNNLLDFSYVSPPYSRNQNSPTDQNLKSNTEKVRQYLIAKNFQYKLLEFWWGIAKDGTYSAEKIQERGMYNATDEDVSKADASKIGRAELGDAGEKLIGNSYILVYEFRNIKTMKEIYDEQDRKARARAKKKNEKFEPVKRTKNGYQGDVIGYLYRLSYNDTIQAYFYKAFDNENTINMKKFNSVYDSVSTPISYVSYADALALATQRNDATPQRNKQELFNELVSDGVASLISEFSNKLEQFRVKTHVETTSPIAAKIGKKEGISSDQRFFVWEYYEKNGETKTRRKAIVRSKKVHDNRNDELGKTGTTTFYQVAGGRVREGMLMQERKDAGVALSLGFINFAEKNTFLIRGEYNISRGFSSMIDMPIVAFKGFVDISFTKDEDRIVNETKFEKLNNIHLTFGVAKEFYFARRFHTGIILGGGLEQASWKDSDENDSYDDSGNYSSLFYALGGKFGVNVGGTFEIVATVMYNKPIGDVVLRDSENEEVARFSEGWNSPNFFEERQGISFDIGIRKFF